jgi:hypothetical protein
LGKRGYAPFFLARRVLVFLARRSFVTTKRETAQPFPIAPIKVPARGGRFRPVILQTPHRDFGSTMNELNFRVARLGDLRRFPGRADSLESGCHAVFPLSRSQRNKIGVSASLVRSHYAFSAGLELVEDCPPLRPAWEASSRFCEKERFDGGTLWPPLLAISRCFSGLIEAKPRFEADLVPAIVASLGS